MNNVYSHQESYFEIYLFIYEIFYHQISVESKIVRNSSQADMDNKTKGGM